MSTTAQPLKVEDLRAIPVKEKAYDFGVLRSEVPEYISDNLKHALFDWQRESLEYFLTYQEVLKKERESKPADVHAPVHLMFNMATGAGKTLLMAACMLYCYKQGYRHFLFFVNRNNIVGKTEDNFLDKAHAKYLFKEKIIIDDVTVNVKKVETFGDNPQGIEIKFTSIQKLYNDIHLQKENRTTLEDLHRRDIVMLADEAHHLNSETRSGGDALFHTAINGLTGKAEVERRGWEHTVIRLILQKNDPNRKSRNMLLEFTATIPATDSIAAKYRDKIIYKFGLKEFLQAGCTKEINLIASNWETKERVLHALLFQWYRHKIAVQNGIPNFKPVILFRSKTIKESGDSCEEFIGWMENLRGEDFDFLSGIQERIAQTERPELFQMGLSRTEQVLRYIKKKKIRYADIAEWLRANYGRRNVIITNSKTNKTQKEKTDAETEKLLNSLEDRNNHIRAIFTVERLTEGWDVLNLFDIVRLYQGQNAGGSAKKTPEATTKEKQLIGRGVRYCPFAYRNALPNKRKFDDDLNNELRVLEELYYYTYDEDSRYISHLKQELKKDGYISDYKVTKTFALKPSFKNSDFYKTTRVWYNERVDNPHRLKNTLEHVKKDFCPVYKIRGVELDEQQVDLTKPEDVQKLNLKEGKLRALEIKCRDIERHIFLKAVNIKAKQEDSLFRFDRLSKELNIAGMDELQTDKLADFSIKIIAGSDVRYDDIDNAEKLRLVMRFLEDVFARLKGSIAPKIGGEFVAGEFKRFFAAPKTKVINPASCDDDVVKNKWYVLDGFAGTDQEKALVDFIKDSIGNLEDKYDEIYLLRNEEVYKIYDFEKGRGFQPDFLLFLKSREDSGMYYQIFIEPKQDKLRSSDAEVWKEEFLQKIAERYGADKIIRERNLFYRLIGLPFFHAAGDHKELVSRKFSEKWKTDILGDSED